MPWVPTVASEVGPWAKEQAKLFSSSEIQNGISNGARIFEEKLSGATRVVPDLFAPMSEAEIENWVLQYVAARGYPLTPADGIRFARGFVIANCNEIGLPPEFIAASELIENFPDSPEEALTWALDLSGSFLSVYGVSIVDVSDVSSFLSASARAAVSQVAPGIPFALFEATFDALSDGRLTSEEAKGIVIGAAGFIGAAVGQAFGLPAPIGALLGQLLVGGLVEAFGWGPSDSDKLHSAQSAASAAAAQATRECTDLSIALWLEYQHYWESISGTLNQSIRQSQEWLTPSGHCGKTDGIRLFGSTTLDVIRDPYGNPLVSNPEEVRKGKKPKYRTYPYNLTRDCTDLKGCPYLSFPMEPLINRDKFALSPGELGRVPTVSRGQPGCDGTSALLFWGARRYVTPMQVFFAMQGKPDQWVAPSDYTPSELKNWNYVPWEQVLHSDKEYLTLLVGNVGTVNFGTEVGPCPATAWAAFMFRSLEQAAAAAALVERDLARTVSAATTEYGIRYHLEQAAGVKWEVASASAKRAAQKLVTSRAAGLRHAVIEAKRRGQRKADLLNYGLLTAGSAALAGWTFGGRR